MIAHTREKQIQPIFNADQACDLQDREVQSRVRKRRKRELLRLLRTIIRSRISKNRPFILSHLITTRCNARCKSCLWLEGPHDDLELAYIERMYADARDLGFIINVIWGGEPTVRKDLPQIIEASQRNAFYTTVITNGFLLPRQLPSYGHRVDTFILSVDYPSEYHDVIRGVKGMFRNILKSIDMIQTDYPDTSLFLNTVVSRLNFEKIPELIELSRELGVSIYFSFMETGLMYSEGFRNNLGYMGLSDDEITETCKTILDYRTRGYDVNNTESYLYQFMGGKKPFACHYQKVITQVRACGDVENCARRDVPFGNVRETSFKKILASADMRAWRRRSETCNACNNPDVITTSKVWALRWEDLKSVPELYRGG